MNVSLSAILCLLWAFVAQASPHPELVFKRAPNAVTGHVTAIGIGVSDLGKAKKFYSIFGYNVCIRGNFDTWSEDICAGSPSFIPMKFKNTPEAPERSVKDLPVKITFTTPNPKSLAERCIKGGGSAAAKPTAKETGAKEGTVYVKDPDGYLLELIPGGGGLSLVGVAYGSSNVTAGAQFFSTLFATSPKPVQKTEAWDVVTVPTKRAFSVHFLDWHEEVKRATTHLPLKIVIAVPDIPGFKKTITSGGGTIPKGGESALGGAAAFGNSPIDQILIEINRG